MLFETFRVHSSYRIIESYYNILLYNSAGTSLYYFCKFARQLLDENNETWKVDTNTRLWALYVMYDKSRARIINRVVRLIQV